MELTEGSSFVELCTFSNNARSDHGGAIVVAQPADLTLWYAGLYNNTAPLGGAVWLDGTSTMIVTDLSYNEADAGGAIYVSTNGQLVSDDGIQTGNIAEEGGANYVAGNAELYNQYSWFNTATYGGTHYVTGTMTSSEADDVIVPVT